MAVPLDCNKLCFANLELLQVKQISRASSTKSVEGFRVDLLLSSIK